MFVTIYNYLKLDVVNIYNSCILILSLMYLYCMPAMILSHTHLSVVVQVFAPYRCVWPEAREPTTGRQRE